MCALVLKMLRVSEQQCRQMWWFVLNRGAEHAAGNAIMAAGPCRAKDSVQRMRRALHEGAQGGLSRGRRVCCYHMLPCLCCCGEYLRCRNHQGPGNV